MSQDSGHVLADPVTEADIGACGGYTEEFFTKLHAKYGKVAKFYTMGALNISLADPADIHRVHHDLHVRPGVLFPILNYLGKDNLLFRTDAADIKKIRDRYTEIIRNEATMELMHATTVECLEQALDKWEAAPGAVDVHKELGWIIYDIMGRVMFGSQWSAKDNGQRIKELHQYCIENSNRWAYLPEEAKKDDPDYQRYNASIAELREICGRILDEKRAEGVSGRKDAFSLLIGARDEAGEPFFGTEFAVSTMIGFLNGAYDTTHSTLHWALFHLARFPAAQEGLRRAVVSALGARGRFSKEKARLVPALENFVKESQRHKATTPFNLRTNLDNDKTIGGVDIPKGTSVATPYFLMYKDPKVFGRGADDPECFDPSRWEGKGEAALERASYLTPFGGGPRMCIGFMLAKIEIKAALVCVLRRSRLSLPEPVELPMPTMLEAGVLQPTPAARFRIRFAPRPAPSTVPPAVLAAVLIALLAVACRFLL